MKPIMSFRFPQIVCKLFLFSWLPQGLSWLHLVTSFGNNGELRGNHVDN